MLTTALGLRFMRERTEGPRCSAGTCASTRGPGSAPGHGLWLRWVPFSIACRANRRWSSGTPQAYRSDLDPGEQRDYEQIVDYARQQQQHRYYPRGQRVAGVAPPTGIRFEPLPQREQGDQEGEDEDHEGCVVDEAVEATGSDPPCRIGFKAHECHRCPRREEECWTEWRAVPIPRPEMKAEREEG